MELERLGAPVRLASGKLSDLRALRLVRNVLTHELWLDPEAVPATLRDVLRENELGELAPTPALVRRGFRAVGDTVAAVDVSLMLLVERHEDRFPPDASEGADRLRSGPRPMRLAL
jgi:hypothetical protein